MQCIGLDQDAIEIQRAEQLLEGRLFTGFVGVIGRLGQGHAKGSGVDGDLGNEPAVAVFCLDRRAPQGFPVTDQLVQTLGTTWDRLIIQACSTWLNSCRWALLNR